MICEAGRRVLPTPYVIARLVRTIQLKIAPIPHSVIARTLRASIRPRLLRQHKQMGYILYPTSVSIHAPTRRATLFAIGRHPVNVSFNPRPHAGGDLAGSLATLDLGQFQSTPPRGGRQPFLTFSLHYKKFQSTPPRGGRPGRTTGTRRDKCFNPRPHAEGDSFRHRSPSRKCKFQSTPPRGGRPGRIIGDA